MSNPVRSLLSWLDDPETGRGIHFAEPGGGWSYHPYPLLALTARRIAAGLRDAGIGGRDVVTIMLRSGPHVAAALFGVLTAGATPALLAPPRLFGDSTAHAEHLARCVTTARAKAIVTDHEMLGLAGGIAARAGDPRVYDVATLSSGTDVAEVPRPGVDEVALIQFTSGSTGTARGVSVPFGAVERSIDSIRHWLGMDGTAATASWLPPHHDMGLIGCLLTPVVDRSDIWLLRPEDFVRDPLRYLECFRQDVRLSAMPGFGLDHIVRRVRPDRLAGLDLSGWRALVLGAERLTPSTMDLFTRLLAPAGFDAAALLPAYGLAEATLAVTGVKLDEMWTAPAFNRAALRDGHAVIEPADAPAVRVVSCGRAMPGIDVRVVGADGELPEGRVGEIVLRGTTLATGYTNAGVDTSASLTSFRTGGLYTGDAGFLLAYNLYVLGRLGDSIKVRGRMVFAEDLECALADAGVPRQRSAVVLGQHDDRPTMIALLEHSGDDWLTATAAVLRPYVDSASVLVSRLPRGAITRTTSGKPRRRQLWHDFLDDRLPVTGLPKSEVGTQAMESLGGVRSGARHTDSASSA